MPPKPKYTREEIIEAAFEFVKKNGIDALAARSLAGALHCTVSPIFTVFRSMEEIRIAVYERAKNTLSDYLQDSIHYDLPFKAFGLRWVSFAKEQPHLYRLIFSGQAPGSHTEKIVREHIGPVDVMLCSIQKMFELSENDAKELMSLMLIYANGVASFIISGFSQISEDVIGRLFSEVCIGNVLRMKIASGSLEPEMARIMALSTDRIPRRITEGKNA